MKFAKITVLFGVYLCCSIAQAQEEQPHQIAKAIIGVPGEVQLSETTALPVMVQMQGIGNEPFPEKVVLHASYGRFIEGEKAKPSTVLNLHAGRGDTILSLSGYGMNDKELFELWVTPLATSYPILGEVKIKLRQQSEVLFSDSPKGILAGGKSTGNLTALIKDQYGEPMEDVACFLQGYILDDRSPTLFARTNAEGQAIFTLPATKRVNAVGLFQVITKVLVSQQIRIDYSNVKQDKVEPPPIELELPQDEPEQE